MVKIGDFGLAAKLNFEGERKRTKCGTPNYIAPEVFEGNKGHSYEADVWALGIILYTLLIGRPPFESSDIKDTYRKIKNCSYDFPRTPEISELAKGLISDILTIDPAERPTLDDILAHAFFTSARAVPKLLPASTLVCPPPESFLALYGSRNAGVHESIVSVLNENTLTSSVKEVSMPPPLLLMKSGAASARPNYGKTTDKEPGDQLKPGMEVARLREAEQLPCVSVVKWLDYSSKYGLGYLLSNGASGVYFNDATSLTMDPEQQ